MTQLTVTEINFLAQILSQQQTTVAKSPVLLGLLYKLQSMGDELKNPVAEDKKEPKPEEKA